jgi:hypothetical protein
MTAASNAETHAMRVLLKQETNEKIDELARAVAELARAVRQIKSAVS